MRITAAIVENFKRVDHVELAPEGDCSLILIGGRNAQGKSSLLDALTAAFGGKNAIPVDPVKHGAEEAEILVELDDGAITIRRVIKPGGESTLEVRNQGGKLKKPQDVLDRLVGLRFLDPLAFLGLSAKAQRATLLELIDHGGEIAKLDAWRSTVFDQRTDVGRDHRKAAAQLEGLPMVDPAAAIDVAALDAEKTAIAADQRAGDAARAAYKQAARETSHAIELRNAKAARIADLEAKITTLAGELEVAEGELPGLDETVQSTTSAEQVAKAAIDTAVEQWQAGATRRAVVDAELARANEYNASVFALRAAHKRRIEVAAEADRLGAEVSKLTSTIAEIDATKADLLAKAQLPVPGLGVSDDAVTLNGTTLEQASGAERLRVALALAIAAAPDLHDVWVRDGALLDDQALEDLGKECARMGRRAWVERVGSRDPGAIVIHEGRVLG